MHARSTSKWECDTLSFGCTLTFFIDLYINRLWMKEKCMHQTNGFPFLVSNKERIKYSADIRYRISIPSTIPMD